MKAKRVLFSLITIPNNNLEKLFPWLKKFFPIKLLILIFTAWSVYIRNFFWSGYSRIQTEYGDLPNKSPYSVRIRENTDQKRLPIWTLFTQRFRQPSIADTGWRIYSKEKRHGNNKVSQILKILFRSAFLPIKSLTGNFLCNHGNCTKEDVNLNRESNHYLLLW